MSARPIAARRPAIPPPMTSVCGVVSTTMRLERRGEPGPGDPGPDEAEGLVGRGVLVVAVDPRALLADVDLGVLVRVHAGPGGHAPERVGVELRRAGGHDEAVEAVLLDVLGDLLLAGLGAGEHRRAGRRRRPPRRAPPRRPARRRRSRRCCRRSGRRRRRRVARRRAARPAARPAVAAAASSWRGVVAHAGTSTFSRRARSRWAATWATVAPACRIDSAMSLAPEAAPAT